MGIVFPQSPKYKKTGAFGRHGFKRSDAIKFIDKIKAWQEYYPNFHFMDENKMGYHDYTDEMAYDYDHLSYIGAQKLTLKLDTSLKQWLVN